MACQGVVLDQVLASEGMPGFAFGYAVAAFVQKRVLNENWWAARDSNPGPPD